VASSPSSSSVVAILSSTVSGTSALSSVSPQQSAGEKSLVYFTFSETVKVPVTLSISFSLPANASDPAVIAALQKSVATEVYAAMTASTAGVAPSNVTVVPMVTTAADGSSSIVMRVYTTYSTTVNTSASAPGMAFALDPAGTTAAAVKAASNGATVSAATASLMVISNRAATATYALVNGTLLTGEPPSSFASRLAAVSSVALAALGKADLAVLINSSSIAPTSAAEVGKSIVEITAAGVASVGTGISAAEAKPEYIVDGFISGGVLVLVSIAVAYFYFLRTKKAADLVLSAKSFAVNNPMRSRPERSIRKGTKGLLP
jgi:hypothetical protein